MATGITKREQSSEDSLTAFNARREQIPLPSDGAPVELGYSHKASLSQVLRSGDREFVLMRGSVPERDATLVENSFILDDNLGALASLVGLGVKAKLFYLDPPYCTGFDFQSRSLEHAYNDRMGVAPYIEFMRRRLAVMRECMDDDGSIYVHIGHQMVGYMKVIMDEVFGSENCRNIITRRKCSSKNFTRKQFANVNDFILFYTKGRNYIWNQPGVEAEDDWILREYPKTDEIGRRYKLVPIHAPGVRHGETGLDWRGMSPPPGKHWQYAPSKLDALDAAGDIHWSKNGNPRRKVYWSSSKKRTLTDYWDNYRDAHHQSIKVSGYPTEKNFDMMKMIVGASSDPDDLVIDPFCGSGTTLHAANDLGRRFIGIDASFTAAKATLLRMRHGVTAMGDYVDRGSRVLVQPRLVLDAPPSSADCSFFVERTVYEENDRFVHDLASL